MKFLSTLWLAALLIGTAGAGFFAPLDSAAQDRPARLAPPTRIHFRDAADGYRLRPFVCAWAARPGGRGYLEDCSHRSAILFFVTGARYQLLGPITSQRHLFGVSGPAALHLMGTDDAGRDQFSGFLYGARVSLISGFLACVISIALATLLGTLAGYFKGWTDHAIMSAAEALLVVPWLYLVLAARALRPLDETPQTAFLTIVLILGLVGWAHPARLIRGTVRNTTEREYVLISRGLGASPGHLLRTHVLPSLRPLLAAQAWLLIPRFILAEVLLSFLGLGAGEPAASWGNMLARAQQGSSAPASYWWLLLPGALLALTFLCWAGLARHRKDADDQAGEPHFGFTFRDVRDTTPAIAGQCPLRGTDEFFAGARGADE